MARSWTRTFSLILALLAALATASAQLQFTATRYGVPSQATSVAHGDFNHDGAPDMAVGWGSYGHPGGTVRVYLASSPGAFSAGTDYNVANTPTQIVPGYYVSDGNGLDIAVVHQGQPFLSLLLNNGNGTFRSAPDVPLASPGQMAVAGDFNNDDTIDLAVLECTNSTTTPPVCQIEVLLSNNDGSFHSAALLDPGMTLEGLAVADFNGDGNLDIATTAANPTRGLVYYGAGGGRGSTPLQFNVPVTLTISNPIPSGTAEGPSSIVSGDFNNDGFADLAIVAGNICGSACGEADAHIFLSKGQGSSNFSFKSKVVLWGNGGGGTVVITDLNNDQNQDLVYWNSAHYGGGDAFFAGKGDGTFTAIASNFGNLDISDYTARDMNLDGFNDLLTTSWSDNGALIARNNRLNPNCPPPNSSSLQAKICYLVSGENLVAGQPFTLSAAGNSPAGVGRLEVWVDNVKQYQVLADQLSHQFTLPAGPHTINVIAVDRQIGMTTGSPVGQASVTLNFSTITQCSATTARSVVVCAPQNNSSASSPVHISAAIKPGSSAITAVQVWVDGVKVYQTNTGGLGSTDGGYYLLNIDLPMSSATHRITVQALDSAGAFKATVYATVGSGGGGGGGGGGTGGGGACGAPATARTVGICSPASGASVSSPVQITAAAKAGTSAITAMQIYVDGVKKYEQTNVTSVNTSLPMTTGTHRLTVQAIDSSGAFKATEYVTVQ